MYPPVRGLGLGKILPYLSIEKLIYGGSGLGHHDGKAIFVPMTLPGEIAEVEIISEKKDYAEGIARNLIVSSEERCIPHCPVFGLCGGCQLQHLPAEAQMRHKTEIAKEFIGQIRQKEQIAFYPTIPSSSLFHYRLRAQLSIQNGHIGFFKRKSHEIVPIVTCPLLAPPLNAVVGFLSGEGMAFLTGISEVEIQGTEPGEILIVLTGQGFSSKERDSFMKAATASLPSLSIRGLIVYDKEKRFCLGADFLTYTIRGKTMRVSERSFLQIHGGMHNLLVESILEWADSNDARWLELHAGAGMFTLHLAEHAKSLTSIEAYPEAVADARFNLTAAGLIATGVKNVELLTGRAEALLPRFPSGTFTHLLLDPPRSGITKKEVAEIVRLSPRKILYLSCHPPTLVRDIRAFHKEGYRIRRVQPVDLFPQTGHLEMLVELTPAAVL